MWKGGGGGRGGEREGMIFVWNALDDVSFKSECVWIRTEVDWHFVLLQ